MFTCQKMVDTNVWFGRRRPTTCAKRTTLEQSAQGSNWIQNTVIYTWICRCNTEILPPVCQMGWNLLETVRNITVLTHYCLILGYFITLNTSYWSEYVKFPVSLDRTETTRVCVLQTAERTPRSPWERGLNQRPAECDLSPDNLKSPVEPWQFPGWTTTPPCWTT